MASMMNWYFSNNAHVLSTIMEYRMMNTFDGLIEFLRNGTLLSATDTIQWQNHENFVEEKMLLFKTHNQSTNFANVSFDWLTRRQTDNIYRYKFVLKVLYIYIYFFFFWFILIRLKTHRSCWTKTNEKQMWFNNG